MNTNTRHRYVNFKCASPQADDLKFIKPEGGEGSYLPNCQTPLVIVIETMSLLFCIFINTTDYHLGRYEHSPPSTKELHGLGFYWFTIHK